MPTIVSPHFPSLSSVSTRYVLPGFPIDAALPDGRGETGQGAGEAAQHAHRRAAEAHGVHTEQIHKTQARQTHMSFAPFMFVPLHEKERKKKKL